MIAQPNSFDLIRNIASLSNDSFASGRREYAAQLARRIVALSNDKQNSPADILNAVMADLSAAIGEKPAQKKVA